MAISEQDRIKRRQEQFADAARSAKVVSLPNSNGALLIEGQVIEVNPPQYAEMLARALRSAGEETESAECQPLTASGPTDTREIALGRGAAIFERHRLQRDGS